MTSFRSRWNEPPTSRTGLHNSNSVPCLVARTQTRTNFVTVGAERQVEPVRVATMARSR